MTKYVTSVLRYPGGKSCALSMIIPRFPDKIEEYREPFIGGGSVFIRVKQLLGDDVSYAINDLNPDLILFWRELQTNSEELIEFIREMKQRFATGRELYRYCLESAASMSNFEKSARFFIMNRITFSGLIDSGGYSQESYEKRFTESVINKMYPLSELLQGVKITLGDYTPHLSSPGENVFIFLDPPYLVARKSKLYGYNGDLHKIFNHRQFAKCLENCKHQWLMTCEDSFDMRNLFSYSKTMIKWDLNYGMTHSNREGHKKRGNELLIGNYAMDINEKYPFPPRRVQRQV